MVQRKFDDRLYGTEQEPFNALCFNCGTFHSTANCEFPSFVIRCPRCLVYSFNGSGHAAPCAPINTVSMLRSDIQAKLLLPMFQIRIPIIDGMHFLNMKNGQFEELVDGQTFLSPATDGLFAHKINQNYQVLSYGAVSFRRFSLVICVFTDGYWRMRFRAVPTDIHGLLLFKMATKFSAQNTGISLGSDHQNTVLFVGIKPKADDVKIGFRIFASPNSDMNPYIKSATWQNSGPDLSGIYTIDDELDGNRKQSKKSFNPMLYQQRQKPLMPFRSHQS